MTKHIKKIKIFMGLMNMLFFGSICHVLFRGPLTYTTTFWLLFGLSALLFLGEKRRIDIKKAPVYEETSKINFKYQPELIHPYEDGSLHLSAELGYAIGEDIEYMPKWRAYGWFTASSRVEWNVEVGQSGEYEVHLEWSVTDQEAGKPFLFLTNDQKLTGKIESTGSWEVFKSKKVGRIHLSEGIQGMIFKPGSTFKEGALLDLRGIWLHPVNGE